MSIKALAILFTASAAVASSVHAQTAEQNAPPLPQFMSTTVRDELAQSERETDSISQIAEGTCPPRKNADDNPVGRRT